MFLVSYQVGFQNLRLIMKLFSYLYQRVIVWSRHRHANRYLACVAFAESSFFPIPPDVMIMSMGLAHPNCAFRCAKIATIASVLGGVFGYFIGLLFSQTVYQFFAHLGYVSQYDQVSQWFHHYGIWIIFLAGFSPIPYKIFTVTAGIMHLSLLPFILTSLAARGLRFFLLAALLKKYGQTMHDKLQRHIELIGWLLLFLALVIYFFIRS